MDNSFTISHLVKNQPLGKLNMALKCLDGPEFKSAKHCNQNQRQNILFRYTLKQKKEFKFNVTNRVDLA